VQKAEDDGVEHEEMHGKLTHVASKGILSSIDGEKVVIGSLELLNEHHVEISEEQARIIEEYTQWYHLLYLGYKVIGKGFTLSTLFSIIWMAIFSTIAHRFTPITTDPFLGAIFGGIILGIGVGLIIRNGGSLDGSEIVAIIFDKRSTFSVGEIVMAMNLVILGAAGFVYSWNSAMYSLIAYFVAYRMMDLVITGVEESKGVMVITDKSEEVADVVMHRLGRGVTLLYGEGAYTKTPKRIIYCVVTRLELTKLKDIIYEVDENAFITINDVHDVFGGQFGKKSIH